MTMGIIRSAIVMTCCVALTACNGSGPASADKAVVRAWLKDNLGDPHWEEIKWEGPVSATSRDLDGLKKLMDRSQNIDNIPDLRTKPRKYVRLKYRHKQGLLGPVVTEQVFDVSGKEAKPVAYKWEVLMKGKTGV